MLVANVGVLVGIIFLAAEIQQNTNVARFNAYRAIIEDYSSRREMIISDPELTDIWRSFTTGDISEFSQTDRTRINQLLRWIFESTDSAFNAYQSGIMGESEWSRIMVTACTQKRRIERNDMTFPSTAVTTEFAMFLNENCVD